MSGIVLVVTVGPDSGRRFPIATGAFRVIGRAYDKDMTATIMIPQGERRRFDAQDQRLVQDHLRRRANLTRPGARPAVDNFERAEDVDLHDEAVSQTHAMVFCDEAGVSVVDVASKNGTSVNGRKVTETHLLEGDLIRVGETRLQVQPAS